MMFSKTQTEIMKVFASKITVKFSIRQISELLKKPYPLVHRSIKALVDNKIVSKDEKGFLSLNYKENHSDAAYMESLRKENFLLKNKTIALFAKDALSELKADFFIFLIFGSSAAGKKTSRDIDILLIVPDKNYVNELDKTVNRIASNFTIIFDCNVISAESAREMLSKRDEANVMNETLNNHIIIFGAENYYRLLKYAR